MYSTLIVYFNQRTIGGKPVNDIGDIVRHVPEGGAISRRILNNPGFLKLVVTNLPSGDVFNMINLPELNPVELDEQHYTPDPGGDLPTVLNERRFKLRFGQSGVNPTIEHQTIDVADLVLWDKAGTNATNSTVTFDTVSQQFVTKAG